MSVRISKNRPVVKYGFKDYFIISHTFGLPQYHLRVGDSGVTAKEAHNNIKQTLAAAFDLRNPNSILRQVSERFNITPEDVESVQLDFINFGCLQLVYLAALSVPTETVHLVLLINQPEIPLGRVEAEFANLQRLAEIDPQHIVEPYAHFSFGAHELYAAPYLKFAQCINTKQDDWGDDYRWGVFEPDRALGAYLFRAFSDDIIPTVTSSMIALLVRYYDEEKGRGLAQTHLSGDDFMFTQDFCRKDPTSVLPNMKLAAARGWVEASLEEYLAIIRREFVIGTRTYHTPVVQGDIIVNHKSILPLSLEEIDAGIELGLRLRTQGA
ncbi:MAG: hypothetical protein ABIH22_00505 [Candidatus Margulisiibacteriota bacterium]